MSTGIWNEKIENQENNQLIIVKGSWYKMHTTSSAYYFVHNLHVALNMQYIYIMFLYYMHSHS